MSKKILIVESESALSRNVRSQLEDRGFRVQETSDGRGSVELIRREKPDLVVMEVELSAGQNGYILCGKLKKDEDLKHIPVIIVGSADGFAQHKKLKTRADEYVPKPLDAQALLQAVGSLIGLPEAGGGADDDEGLSLSELVDIESAGSEVSAEEISVDAEEESQTLTGDAELDLLEAAFDEASGERPAPSELGVDIEAEISEVDVQSPSEADREDFSSLLRLAEDADESTYVGSAGLGGDGHTHVQFGPMTDRGVPERPALGPGPRPSTGSTSDSPEHRSLRARVLELERGLADANGRAETAEGRARNAEEQLASRTAELESARASGGRHDKEFFALREAANKKDKEILRLKSEINAKENEIVEVRDNALQLEQRTSEASAELARRDTQIKTLTHKADQLGQDRKRLEQQLTNAREEGRSAVAALDALQTELDDAREQLAATRAELEETRNEVERLRPIEEEATALRGRVVELEEQEQKHEQRVARFYARLREDEQIREKTRKALAIALQLLDEQQQAQIEIDLDDESAGQ